MSDGLITAEANSLLDSIGTAFPYIQLHVGAPGAAGTANVAVNNVRKLASWASAASGSKATNADLAWTSVAGSETYTHYTMWSASSGGTCGHSGAVTAPAVTTGDNFTISSGGLVLTFPVAA